MTIKPGAFRFNTDSLKLEYYDGNQWVNITTDSPEAHTDGTRGIFYSGNVSSDDLAVCFCSAVATSGIAVAESNKKS